MKTYTDPGLLSRPTALSLSPPTNPKGLKKLGRYDLVRVIGKGAMGLVYEGRDPNLERRVAIKTIRVESLSEKAAAEYEVRFRTEARSAGRLQHPNIVSVYDSDRDGDIAFLVMEYVAGHDLKYHLEKGQRYTLMQTLSIMSDLLSALAYAHQQNIVHRDIKPANLLMEESGRVKLTDFGIARIQDSGETTLTQDTLLGTVKYMSPEQMQALPLDARADLFAAGVLLYQLLTGQRPFEGETDFATIHLVISHEPAPPSSLNPQLPVAIDAVLACVLAKDRAQRYSSAQEFQAALHEATRDSAALHILPLTEGDVASWTVTSTGSTFTAAAAEGGGTSVVSPSTAVSQEAELVYWKDVKESQNIEDIWGFLSQFPSGIYAELALRRLRELGGLAQEEADTGFQVKRESLPPTGPTQRKVPVDDFPLSARSLPAGAPMPTATARTAKQAVNGAEVMTVPGTLSAKFALEQERLRAAAAAAPSLAESSQLHRSWGFKLIRAVGLALLILGLAFAVDVLWRSGLLSSPASTLPDPPSVTAPTTPVTKPPVPTRFKPKSRLPGQNPQEPAAVEPDPEPPVEPPQPEVVSETPADSRPGAVMAPRNAWETRKRSSTEGR